MTEKKINLLKMKYMYCTKQLIKITEIRFMKSFVVGSLKIFLNYSSVSMAKFSNVFFYITHIKKSTIILIGIIIKNILFYITFKSNRFKPIYV